MSDIKLKDVLKKLRSYEIKIRKAVNQNMHGDYHSVFKGSGIEFDDVRQYSYGDDVRNIDWNVTAKGHGTFIKVFKEEKEQVVFFMVDVSASQDIGKDGAKKIDLAKEIAGVLALSAIKEDSRVGAFCFSDQKEKYIKPDKGIKFGYELISNILKLSPKSARTDLSKSILYTLNAIKRRSIIILISDFIDENYMQSFKALANKHDLVAIHLSDRREAKLPGLGIIPLYDKEAKKTIWINSSSSSFKNSVNQQFNNTKSELEKVCRATNSSYLQIFTNEDYVSKLVRLFNLRSAMR
ncbi:MAG: DUF58 domain-containing protein [Cytophagales bacterium]|nr:DUF58 domain-containing protein [Cytophagales bacterium]